MFGNTSKSLLIQEYDKLINFLDNTSKRIVGDETELKFKGSYSKLLIVIIGKADKIKKTDIYIRFIKNTLNKEKIDTIYALGDHKNKTFIEIVCKSFNSIFDIWHKGESKTILNYNAGEKKSANQYFIILRKKEQDLLY